MNGNQCLALIDSGSQITSMSEKFYKTHLLHIPITNCDGLIRIEGAGGDAIPYLGYVTVSVSIEGFKSIDAPILIVRNTAYNASVPIIVGTNILSRVQKDH